MTEDDPTAYATFRNRVIPDRIIGAEAKLGMLMRSAPIPEAEISENLSLFFSPRILKRVLYMAEIYQRILPVHGVVMQFGTRWGRDISVFDCLRHIYEPFNLSRTVIGFDTFEGFPSVHGNDGTSPFMREGQLGTTEGYVDFLRAVVDSRQQTDPLPGVKRCEIVKGDACVELERWLDAHPEAIVALAHFDMDIYEPTKRCLELLKDRVTKGTVLAFDELNWSVSPGETVALRETFGLSRFAIQRSPRHSGQGSFIVVD